MLCKVCNTRIPRQKPSCPNCGSPAPTEPLNSESVGVGNLPEIEFPEAETDSPDVPEEVALEGADSLDLDEEMPNVEQDFQTDEEAKETEPVIEPASRVHAAHPLGTIDTAGVRRMLVERPEMLEADLSVYTSEKGTPLGAGYTSGVGEIDLLARDRAGDLVVVMVAEPREGVDIISVMLQRIGWVRKHLSGDASPVRGVVLLDEMREDLAYAASAVSDTIAFKTYQIALAFEDIEP